MRLIKNSKRFFILCGGVLVWCAVAGQSVVAITLENPYREAVKNRNLFQLQAPKPPDVPPPPPPPPLREIKLSGITTLPSATRAILRVMGVAKSPEAAKEISLFLSPGDAAENGVQVLEIDVAHGLVKISNDGTLQTLDITKNAPKAAVASPTAVSPFPPPRAGGVMTPPAGAPPVPSNDEQTWTMALHRERDLGRVAAGQMRAEDVPPYPPNEVSAEADKEAMQGSP